jgi:pyruvate formate lyase activating enzyme
MLAFARYLDQIGKPVWIRHVVVPGITYEEEELTRLGQFLGTLRNVEKLEVLPYHSMGKVKYDSLGIAYPLKDTPQLTKTEAAHAEAIIRAGM